ncbi:MAG: SAF domain-containing protein [Actinomycetota bacterium]|nr:SAF domain-containing protein [Actinomycetota bacterium]
MFWLTRPPYVRWAVAVAIVAAALVWDLRGSAQILYPFASGAIAAGTPITDSQVVWRSIPEGLMEMPDLVDPIAARDVGVGEPIVPSAVSGESMIPNGWWSVPIPLPGTAIPGTLVRLVGVETVFETNGIVVSVAGEELLSFSESGMVAVPPDFAALVAIAARDGTLIVLLDP